MKYGLPSRAGMPTTGASIWARKEPQLLPRSKSGCSRSMIDVYKRQIRYLCQITVAFEVFGVSCVGFANRE